MESITVIGSMPSATPTNKETMIKVTKGFSLNLVIKRKSRTIPKITMAKGILQFVFFKEF
jgi:hypothetical protein